MQMLFPSYSSSLPFFGRLDLDGLSRIWRQVKVYNIQDPRISTNMLKSNRRDKIKDKISGCPHRTNG